MTAPGGEERDRFLTVAEVSAWTTLAPGTLYSWRSLGKGPRTTKFGGRVVYRLSDIKAWIAAQERDARSES